MEKRVWVFLWVRDFFWVLWSDCVLRLQISQFWSFVYVTLILLNLLFESLVLWLGLLKVYRLVTFHVSILFPHPCLCAFLHQFCRSVFVLDICCFIFTFSSHSSFFGFLLLPLSLWLVPALFPPVSFAPITLTVIGLFLLSQLPSMLCTLVTCFPPSLLVLNSWLQPCLVLPFFLCFEILQY